MNILAEIHRRSGIDIKGKITHRAALRGVILRGRNLLRVHSSTVGDYKFLGGGVEEGEAHVRALSREIQEECGASLTHVEGEIGIVIEYNIPIQADCDIFKMTSHYYSCAVEERMGTQKLDGYERTLGFEPV